MKKSFSMHTSFLAFAFIIILFASCKKSSDSTPPPPPPVLPAINSFSPATGSAGTTVTISGKNFSPTIASDVVSFNGTAATVTSATADQIIVTVPNDAATGKITVKVGSNTASSTDNFTVTLNQLSEARNWLAAAAAGNKIVFAGGQYSNSYSSPSYSKAVDIYDVLTNTWSTTQLSEARGYLAAAAAGNKIVFAGGYGGSGYSKTVDIYDVTTNIWTTAELSEARNWLAAAATGNKILFAGGVINNNFDLSTTVDIYDVSTNMWSTTQLPGAGYFLEAAAVGSKVIFTRDGVAFIYDVNTNMWSTAVNSLSNGLPLPAAAATGNKALFKGGEGSKVNMYDLLSNTWSTADLSAARWGLAAAATDNKVLFGGGFHNGGPSKRVDIYDVVSNIWSTAELSAARRGLAAAATGNKIVFAGGGTDSSFDINTVKTVDIYDVDTGMWYH